MNELIALNEEYFYVKTALFIDELSMIYLVAAYPSAPYKDCITL